jgi:hypothetical protein
MAGKSCLNYPKTPNGSLPDQRLLILKLKRLPETATPKILPWQI